MFLHYLGKLENHLHWHTPENIIDIAIHQWSKCLHHLAALTLRGQHCFHCLEHKFQQNLEKSKVLCATPTCLQLQCAALMLVQLYPCLCVLLTYYVTCYLGCTCLLVTNRFDLILKYIFACFGFQWNSKRLILNEIHFLLPYGNLSSSDTIVNSSLLPRQVSGLQ